MCRLHHFKPALCPFCRSLIVGFDLAPAEQLVLMRLPSSVAA
jgi:hypothetical protein